MKGLVKATGVAIVVAAAMVWMSVPAQAQDTLKIAYIEGLSGAFANVGRLGQRHFQLYADMVNRSGGVNGQQIEMVFYDNQMDAKVAVEKVNQAIADGADMITQGNSSGIAHAITDAVLKYNTRNPGKEVLFLNYAAVDPALTNEKCNFWHFRFDANADIKMKALVKALVDSTNMKKVYLIGQNYSFGQAVAAAAVHEIGAQAPGAEIVGNELHPIGKVKDFTPYVNKIRASGADTVITGNWGNDMLLLVKAISDSGLKVKIATYYGGGLGTPRTLGAKGEGLLLVVQEGVLDDMGVTDIAIAMDYRAKYLDEGEEFSYPRVHMLFEYLIRAAKRAGTNEPKAIARQLEGMEVFMPSGRTFMRKDDHQVFMPMYVAEFSKDVIYDVERTGFGWKTLSKVTADDSLVPTTCKMERP